MEAILYINNSDDRYVSKSLGSKKSIDVTLKADTDIISPTLILSSIDDFTYNYLYIPTFKRYYYITNITSIRNNLMSISCKVDVLMSFKSSIKDSSGVIERSESDYNLYLEDSQTPIYANPKITTKNFPGSLDGESYLIIVAG